MHNELSTLANGCSKMSTAVPAAPIPAGVYIHVPFCRSKCPYCDFYSITDHRLIPEYVEAVLAELKIRRHRVPHVDSIYFGGGTPSLLAPRQLAQLLEGVDACYAVTGDAEVTLEVNPGTANREKLAEYRRAGINRLNIGLQSIDDPNLIFLGRIHTAQKGIDTYRWAREAGFDNVGVDLIYGVPGQTREGWQTEMAGVIQMVPDHLSFYALTMEPGTPMTCKVNNGLIEPLEEKTAGDLFSATAAYLKRNGYRHYEVSNYALNVAGDPIDRRSRHNRKYWTFAPYLGFGPAAHSFLDHTRWWNHRSLDAYLEDIKAGKNAEAERETLTRDQQIMEFVYLGLRQTDGIDPAGFALRFKADFCEYFEPQLSRLAKEGLVDKSPGRIRLTGRGMRFLERVVDRLLS